MNKFVVALVNFVKILAKPFYPLKVYGPRDMDNKKCLVVGNHLSGWDPIMYVLSTKHIVSFVYKADLQDSAFLRWVFDGMDFIPVRRGEVDIAASKSILRLLKDDKTVCIFPEGTRNPQVDCLQEFHTGPALFALKTRAPLRPFYIWDKAKPFRKNYMYIGEEFTLEQFYDKPLTKDTLAEATEVVKQKVEELRLKLNAILAEKGVKRRKRTKKEMRKLQQFLQKKQAEEQALQQSSVAQTDQSQQGGGEA